MDQKSLNKLRYFLAIRENPDELSQLFHIPLDVVQHEFDQIEHAKERSRLVIQRLLFQYQFQ